MSLAESFEFLPYGKYAFYIWTSYLLALITIATLFIRSRGIHKRVHNELRMKYTRDN